MGTFLCPLLYCCSANLELTDWLDWLASGRLFTWSSLRPIPSTMVSQHLPSVWFLHFYCGCRGAELRALHLQSHLLSQFWALVFIVWGLEAQSCYVAQADFNLSMVLSQPFQFWDLRHVAHVCLGWY